MTRQQWLAFVVAATLSYVGLVLILDLGMWEILSYLALVLLGAAFTATWARRSERRRQPP